MQLQKYKFLFKRKYNGNTLIKFLALIAPNIIFLNISKDFILASFAVKDFDIFVRVGSVWQIKLYKDFVHISQDFPCRIKHLTQPEYYNTVQNCNKLDKNIISMEMNILNYFTITFASYVHFLGHIYAFSLLFTRPRKGNLIHCTLSFRQVFYVARCFY